MFTMEVHVGLLRRPAANTFICIRLDGDNHSNAIMLYLALRPFYRDISRCIYFIYIYI